jgi:hypothetical protein
MPRSGAVRVLRNNEVLYEGELLSLKHLKVRSVLIMLSGTVRVLRNNDVLYKGELLSLKHFKVRSVLNNAQRHSARTQEQRGSLRGGAFKSQTFEGKKCVE